MSSVEVKSPRRQIGRILRAFREKTGRRISDVARSAGISTSMLSQIERGQVAPSIDTLFQVCEALGLETADLFGRLAQRSPVRVVHQGQRLVTESQGARFEQLVSSADSSHPAEMVLFELGAHQEVGIGGQGHEGVEMGYVLTGSAKLSVGEETHALTAGDSVSFASHLPHRLTNDSGQTFRAVWSVLPPHTDYLGINGD